MAKTKKTESESDKPIVEAVEVKEDKKAKLESLKARAKKLAEETNEESKDKKDIKKELKKEIKAEKGEIAEKENALVPIEDYLKASIHLGTRVITPDMRKYVYRRRADGLAVFNTAMLDDEIRKGAEYLATFNPANVMIVGKREAGWKAIKKFSEITGIRSFTKKYPAGILTNTTLENFTEVDLVFVVDPWLDKNAMNDAIRINVPVLSICDTNNYTQGITVKIPGNNKSGKSIGLILYLVSKLFCEIKKMPFNATINDFIDDWDSLLPPK